MEVFVYSKKTSKKLAELNHIVNVAVTPDKTIYIQDEEGGLYSYDTREVKTTIYQN